MSIWDIFLKQAFSGFCGVFCNVSRVLTRFGRGCLPHCCEGLVGNFHCLAKGGGMRNSESNNDILYMEDVCLIKLHLLRLFCKQ